MYAFLIELCWLFEELWHSKVLLVVFLRKLPVVTILFPELVEAFKCWVITKINNLSQCWR